MNKEDITPRDENGLPHGYCELYWSNGTLWYKGYNIHSNRHGYWEVYDNTGQLWYRGNWVHGEKYGLWEYYYPNGKLEHKRYYINKTYFYIHKTSKNKLIL